MRRLDRFSLLLLVATFISSSDIRADEQSYTINVLADVPEQYVLDLRDDAGNRVELDLTEEQRSTLIANPNKQAKIELSDLVHSPMRPNRIEIKDNPDGNSSGQITLEGDPCLQAVPPKNALCARKLLVVFLDVEFADDLVLAPSTSEEEFLSGNDIQILKSSRESNTFRRETLDIDTTQSLLTYQFINQTQCNLSGIGDAVSAQIAQTGLDPQAYDHIYIVSSYTNCPGALGFAYIGGRYGMGLVSVMSHELGHNEGHHHSSHLNNSTCIQSLSDQEQTSNCSYSEYSNVNEMMGHGSLVNAVHKYKNAFGQNLFDPENHTTIEGSGSFNFNLTGVEKVTDKLQVVRIPFRPHPYTGAMTYLLISNHFGQARIHIDEFLNSSIRSLSITDLAPGSSFNFPIQGIQISANSVNGSGELSVTIEKDCTECGTPSGFAITGRISNSFGQGLAGITTRLRCRSGTQTSSTNSAGEFSFTTNDDLCQLVPVYPGMNFTPSNQIFQVSGPVEINFVAQ